MHDRIIRILHSQADELRSHARLVRNLEKVERYKLNSSDAGTIDEAESFVRAAEGKIKKGLVIKMLNMNLFSAEFVISEVENVIRRETEYNSNGAPSWNRIDTSVNLTEDK